MFDTKYADDFIIFYQGTVMRYGALKDWAKMHAADTNDIRPATYEEIVHYSEVQKREV